MEDVKNCPFCGKSKTLQLVRLTELGFEEINSELSEFSHCVCCNVNIGGCGGCGGYGDSKEEVLEKWNKREQIEDK